MENRINFGQIDECEHEIVHEGWLTKLSKRVLRISCVKLKWRKRWFVLCCSGELPGQFFLTYYTDKNCSKMKGRIDIDRVKSINQCIRIDAGFGFENLNSEYHYKFDIKTSTTTYYLAAKSKDDMNRWIDFVSHVCGLKPVPVNENPDTEEHSLLSSSTCTTSSQYIPISKCFSGKPNPSLPNCTRPTLEKSNYSQRLLRKNSLLLKLSLPSLVSSESSPQSSSSESDFTDDKSKDCSSMSQPSINWKTFPILRENSPCIPIAVPPPRPPKPPHLTETPKKSLIEPRSNNSCINTTLDEIKTTISNSLRRHSTSSDWIDQHKMTSDQLKNISSNCQDYIKHRVEARCSNSIQYLDIELELHKGDYYQLLNKSNSSYHMIDHEKTQGLINTLRGRNLYNYDN